MTKEPEKILCAAIWYKDIPLKKVMQNVLPKNCDKGLVVLGHRHGQCMWTMSSLTGLRSVENGPGSVGEYEQGFLTNTNRFVDRKEAALIAYNAGQVNDRVRWYEMTDQDWKTRQLYSEDLY